MVAVIRINIQAKLGELHLALRWPRPAGAEIAVGGDMDDGYSSIGDGEC